MSKWFVNVSGEGDKSNQLFLFPYAGGGASVFRNWSSYLIETDIFAAQYPGRENRIGEKLIKDFDLLINKIFVEICEIISDKIPYFLFGHSLGTKIVYELALKIEKNKLPPPKGLIISAGKAPCFTEQAPIHNLEYNDFIKEISRFSGTPQEIINNKEIMKVFLPMLRADFALDELYKKEYMEQVDCPILSLMGKEDSELTLVELKKWQDYTKKKFHCVLINGDHMFVKTNAREVIKVLESFINEKKNNKSINFS